MITDLVRRMDNHSENFNKEFENINLEEIYPNQVVPLPAYAKI